ncbi:3-keto-disaccharide hydrolase [Flavihumibacter profundi]|uniref:3-keto-disaccharide hydrolase n=1 Tax=Flavihumibacter profundi TaxID=2716883 RepID=UPI001CC56524|nr:DUF1080 domain-containing protein [Flavihumibacter profundi]MBZ5856106.1 DUF1080 domain-containing protein [Flavihumibacter profundi]
MKYLSIPAAILIVTVMASCNNPAPKEKEAETATSDTAAATPGFVPIFDGKSFAGWEGDTSFWHIENGVLTGLETKDHKLKTNTFMIWKGGEPSDFEFKAEYRISSGGNSGVQYRSELVKDIPYALKGYQADIDGADVYTGQNYEERGRGFLAMRGQIATIPTNEKPVITGSLGNPDSLKLKIHPNDWNELHLVVKGNHMLHYVNGVLMSETTDNDTINRKDKGLIGLQLHVMDDMKVEYRNIQLKQ